MLDQLLLGSARSGFTRADALLVDFAGMDFVQDWAFAVSSSHSSALDIRRTSRVVDGTRRMVWTQGVTFDFGEGDTFYNTPAAYTGQWNEAIQLISTCIEVLSGRIVSPAKGLLVSAQDVAHGRLQGRMCEVHRLLPQTPIPLDEAKGLVREQTGSAFGQSILSQLEEADAVIVEAQEKRFPGLVTFQTLTPDASGILRPGENTSVTQDQFVRILILGMGQIDQ